MVLDRRACSSCGFLPCSPTAAVLPARPRSTPAWLLVRRGGASSSSPSPSPPHAASGSDQADARSSPPPPPLLLPVPAFQTEADVLESANSLMWSRLLVKSFQRTVGRPLLPGLEGLDERALVRKVWNTLNVHW